MDLDFSFLVEEKMEDIDEFITDTLKEIKKFIWRIKDFRVTLACPLTNNLSIEFNVGASIGQASKWKMEIKLDDKTGRNLEQRTIQLCVSRVAGEPEAKHFICTAVLKTKGLGGDKCLNLTPFELTRDNPSPAQSVKLEQIFNALLGGELAIHAEFVLWAGEPTHTFVTTAGNNTLCGGVDVLNDYGDLLNTGDNSDFVIQVKKLDGEFEEIRVHKAILSARSSFFKTMLDTGMKERENGTWIIEDLSPECIKIMLKYIYTGNLDDGWKKVPEEIVRAADKYNLSILLNFLDRRLHCACTFTNATNLRKLAKLYELDMAFSNVNAFIRSNLNSILG